MDTNKKDFSVKMHEKSVLKYNHILEKFNNDEVKLLQKITCKDLKLYTKFKQHLNKLKLSKQKNKYRFCYVKRSEHVLGVYKSYYGSTNITLRRGGGELIVFTKAKNFVEYVMNATIKSPKVFRFSFVSKLQNLAIDIIQNLYKANEVIVIKNNEQNKQLRLSFQRQAISSLNLFMFLSESAYKSGCFTAKQFSQFIILGAQVETLIRNWILKDSKRF